MKLLLLTPAKSADDVLPALGVLPYTLLVRPRGISSILDTDDVDAILVDARHDLKECRSLCRTLYTVTSSTPLVAVVSAPHLIAVNPEWMIDDLFLTTTSSSELHARLQLIIARAHNAADAANDGVITLGDLTIDENTYVARIKGHPLDLAYKEFELLKYLSQNAGRVFSRSQLLQEVWGYDFVGGSRTVDVHVRRLRAKLGTEHESLIKTVRNVGYKVVAPPSRERV
ncbi:MAG: response regulator transcription factor [Lawsonella sp.]